jgi:GTP-binding protein
MKIKEAKFIISSTDIEKCPLPDKPEYAFTGRSNVGKSSLINMLVSRKSLAKISGKPGKTRLINHFLINNEWYLVDLPGYGYAAVAQNERRKWKQLIEKYILFRQNLYCLFVLVDSRHKPQIVDLEFIHWLGINMIPFCIVFTKIDKLKKGELGAKIDEYKEKMLENWEYLPPNFASSVRTCEGRDEILNYIHNLNSGSS